MGGQPNGFQFHRQARRHAGGLAGICLQDAERVDDVSIRLRGDLRLSTWRDAVASLAGHLCLPEVDDKALAGLKFSDTLPRHLATAILAARLADLDHAASVLAERVRFER
jgi:ATP-dependent helicase Lhr and Lhr-like helicase